MHGLSHDWRLVLVGISLVAAVSLGPTDRALAAQRVPAIGLVQEGTVAQQQDESAPVDAQQLLRMLQQQLQQMQQADPQMTQQFLQANPPLQQLLRLDPQQADPQQIVQLLQQLDPDLQQLNAQQVLRLMQQQLELQQLLQPLSPQQVQQLMQQVPTIDPQTLQDLSPEQATEQLQQLVQQVRQALRQMGIPPEPSSAAQTAQQPALPSQASSSGPAPRQPTLNADAASVLVVIDAPLGGNASTRLLVRGWAADPRASDGAGVDGVEVYLDGARDAGGTRLGRATYGLQRPDVAAHLGGQQFLLTGYALQTVVAPGPHTVYVYAHPSDQPADQGWTSPKQTTLMAVARTPPAGTAAGLDGALALQAPDGSGAVYVLPGVGSNYPPGPADTGGPIYAPLYYGLGFYGGGSALPYYPLYYYPGFRRHRQFR